MSEILELNFMQNAFIAGILVSIICGLIGSLVVINKMTFIAGGIAHGAYGGIGLAFFFSLKPTSTQLSVLFGHLVWPLVSFLSI